MFDSNVQVLCAFGEQNLCCLGGTLPVKKSIISQTPLLCRILGGYRGSVGVLQGKAPRCKRIKLGASKAMGDFAEDTRDLCTVQGVGHR